MFRVQKKVGIALQQWREYLSCSNTGCSMPGRVWKRVSHRSSNIQVHNARYCAPACFEQELQRRFRKLNSAPGVTPRAPHRMPLGLLMLSRGDIDGQQLRAAVARQQEEGAGRIGEWMQSMGFVGEQQVTAALGAQWSCPVLPKMTTALDCECAVSPPLLRRFRLAPISYIASARMMHVAFADRINYSALLAIEQALACRAEACVCSTRELRLLMEKAEEKSDRSYREFASGIVLTEMVRITSNYAAMLEAREVRMAACDGLTWVRVEGRETSMNLIFPSKADDALAG
jgi:hypothetical protein